MLLLVGRRQSRVNIVLRFVIVIIGRGKSFTDTLIKMLR